MARKEVTVGGWLVAYFVNDLKRGEMLENDDIKILVVCFNV